MYKVLFFSIIFIIACGDSGSEGITEPIEGIGLKVVSSAGQPFEEASFLACPLTHAITTNAVGDTLNVVVLSKVVMSDSIGVRLFSSFELVDSGVSRMIHVAYPTDKRLQVIPPMPFNDFVLKNYAMKVIIDQYFANYKGMARTKVGTWLNTPITEQNYADFASKKFQN